MDSPHQIDAALDIVVLLGVPVRVTLQKKLNSCKDVICSFECQNCEESELKDWLSDQGVIEFKQLGQSMSSVTLLLTLGFEMLLKAVTIDFEY